VPRDARYDILFEPIKIGPVTAKNRFFQVPHCNGMGHARPQGHAAMRGVKAEGGWAVVSTEEVEIHPTSDLAPYIEGRLWDDRDIPALALMTASVHRHGALAAIELVHAGMNANNFYSREVSIAPSHIANPANYAPAQARAMRKADIRDFRRWHRNAALRAQHAGFDIVYVYAGHGLSLPMHFLQSRYNHRTDEYGGSLVNRARLLRELIEDTKEAVGGSCAVAVRLAVDELRGADGIRHDEGREIIEMLAELPDLWDVNVSDWANDSQTSRFAQEGFQEEYVRFVKTVTTKPVVGVGRFTSPDAMVSQVRRGVLDFIGAARPSIADPFLPRKIEAGDLDDIRECIGCNVCVSGDLTMSPIRCTQNPTMGEEWRKGWHPETVPPRSGSDSFLIVGSGPAGLECARMLGRRGYSVHLAEARERLGGRTTREPELPGLASWARVRDYRVNQLNKMPNVEILRGNRVTADEIIEFGATRVVLATGAHWRRDGVGRANASPIRGLESAEGLVLTPDDVMDGLIAPGPVVLFDDDHYYLGSVLAEKLHAAGHDVTLVTPADRVSAWTVNTLEQHRIQKRLMELGVHVVMNHNVVEFDRQRVIIECTYTARESSLPAGSVVCITSRLPNDALYDALLQEPDAISAAGIASVTSIGDCLAPSTIAAAVYAGHRYAREFDLVDTDEIEFRREMP
jgi:dimethylamine/trimethylamine dehydrogenase